MHGFGLTPRHDRCFAQDEETLLKPAQQHPRTPRANPTHHARLTATTLAVVALGAMLASASAQASPTLQLPDVTLVGVTPLPGVGLSKDQIPSAVQTAQARDIAASGALNLADFLNSSLGSVHVNEVQGNPFMVDVNYRGYTASPLLGTPQGLSVYVDGVRQNQPFGDVVFWDLIPKSAISSMALMPGANPLFGLNTLGGALAIDTKDGRKNLGTSLETTVGQFGRLAFGLDHGGQNDKGLDWFLTANTYRESGWRDDSPSRVGQLFGKVGWRDADTDIKLSYAHADTNLHGNGMQQAEMLNADRSSVFTKPDITANRASSLNLQAKTRLSDVLTVSGNAYHRHTRTSTLNGDLNGNTLGQVNDPLACVAAAQANDEPQNLCSGLLNTTRTRQRNAGLSGQFTLDTEGEGLRNLAVVGAALDTSRVQFKQGTQFGYLNADRSITPVDAFADGTQTGLDAFDQRVDLRSAMRTASVFGTNTLSLQDTWHLTASARYNRTRLHNTDGLYPYNNATTTGDQRGSLDGTHVFKRLNPALGLSYTPTTTFNAYLGYSESSRAPTSIELGCADPNFGCRLPNSMAGDPPLNQVVSRSWEMGLRGKLAGHTNWSLGVFRGDNTDDILFVSNTASTGFFKNFGKTRREGIEGGVSTTLSAWALGLNYTYLRATYQSEETVGSEYHSGVDATTGGITIHPGDRIPLMPSQMLKANARCQVLPSWTLGLDLVAVNGSHVRGNENNAHSPDGITTFGAGRTPGYAVLNLSSSYQATRQLKVFGSVNNLFDRQYSTAGQLGPYAFNADGSSRQSSTEGTTYHAPGAPRTLWMGVRYSL